MRSYSALYVDVGYLLASAATRVTGTSLRNAIHVEFRLLIESLIKQAEEMSGLPVLRLHWYDSAKDGIPDFRQERIGELPKVKLRLGRFGMDGQQKGVDLRIGLDLVAHARNQTADVFFLISGDDDLTQAVEEAQAHGVQVVLLAVPNAEQQRHGVSRHLVRACDEVHLVCGETLDQAIMKVDVPPPAAPEETEGADHTESEVRATVTPLDVAALARRTPAPASAAPASAPAPAPVVAYSGTTGAASVIAAGYDQGDPAAHDSEIDGVITRVLQAFRGSASPEALELLDRGRPSIPREIDRALLTDLSQALDQYDLTDQLRFRLRQRFWVLYDKSK